MAIPTITAATLRGWIGDGAELAILDAREEGEFGAAHSRNCSWERGRLSIPLR